MKKFSLFFLVLLFFSCTYEKKVKVPQDKVTRIRAVGERASKELMKELKSNLVRAISKKGTEGAVLFCAKEAEKITKIVNNRLGNIKVSRVSEKYRNPTNRPSKIDVEVLRLLEEKQKEGDLPPFYISAVKKGGKVFYIYYKPLITNQFCLNCHGSLKSMDPKIVRVIKEKYPNDKAVNYKAGELRGVIKVVIPEDEI
ncbi:MAG: DUF3365 domain-containing protein [Desulfurobacteriaceae bacterium]